MNSSDGMQKTRWQVRWIWKTGGMIGQRGSHLCKTESEARSCFDEYKTSPHIKDVELLRIDTTVVMTSSPEQEAEIESSEGL